MTDPASKRYGVEVMHSNGVPAGEPHWFTDPADFRAHVAFLRSLPVDGGSQFRVTEYTLTRVSMIGGGTDE